MDAVTYPDEAVQAAIAQHFEPVQIDTQDGTEVTASTVKKFRQVWTPDLRILDAEGVELYRWNGYLPPSEFLAQLLAGRAHALLRSGRDGDAAEAYQDVLTRFPTSMIAPEAAYFAAVAAYRGSGEPPDLIENWQQLQSRYPDSTWRVRQSFIEQPD